MSYLDRRSIPDDEAYLVYEIDSYPNPEDLDLDELGWAPPRATLGPVSSSETIAGDTPGFDYDRWLQDVWDGTSDPEDPHEVAWSDARATEDVVEKARPLVTNAQVIRRRWPNTLCELCEQVVIRRQFAQHWMRCRDDVAPGQP